MSTYGPDSVVVIGAGHAGVSLVDALRRSDYSGPITLFSEDPGVPYHRPPLSKEYLKRAGNPPIALLKPKSYYDKNNIDLRLGVRVSSVELSNSEVTLHTGERLRYGHLVFATGARNRRPPIPGLNHPNVFELRTLDDANQLRSRFGAFRRVVIIGGGFIGLEVAGLLTQAGVEVIIVEMGERLLARAVSPQISEWFRQHHENSGAKIRFATAVSAINPAASGCSVLLTDGEQIAADGVILAAGVEPNVELAREAGLRVDNGIVVDTFLATLDPHVSAIGDCAAFPSRIPEKLLRLESIQNANDQATALVARLMGRGYAYADLPWFWSNQIDARLQIAGLGDGALAPVLRGDPNSGRFSVFLYDADTLRAVESVNAVKDHIAAKKLLSAGINVPRHFAANPSHDLNTLVS